MHDHLQQVANCIGHNMALAALDFPASIIIPVASSLSGLGTLAIDNSCAGIGLPDTCV
jgi:hypothetical protein